MNSSEETDRRVWSNLVLERRITFGFAARRNRRRHSGTKVHRLVCEYIVGVTAPPSPGTLGARFLSENRPILFACVPACGATRGQFAGSTVEALAPSDVTCSRCLGGGR